MGEEERRREKKRERERIIKNDRVSHRNAREKPKGNRKSKKKKNKVQSWERKSFI